MPLGTHINSTDPLGIGSEAFRRTHGGDFQNIPIYSAPCSPPTDAEMKQRLRRIGILHTGDIPGCLPPSWSTNNDGDDSFWREKLVHDIAQRFSDGSNDESYGITTEKGESSVSVPKALLEIRSSKIIVVVSGVVWGIIETAEFVRDVWQRIRSGWLSRDQEIQEQEFDKTKE